MLISFGCPQCGVRYKVDESRASQSATCRNCSAEIRVPVPPPNFDPGQDVSVAVQHADPVTPLGTADHDSDRTNAISQHIEKFIGPAPMVFQELVPDVISIDVHHVPPTPKRNFHTLITNGMSQRPMLVPEGAEQFQFAELLLCLPFDWPLTREAFCREENYWPIRLLKTLARLPHERKTWLGPGHVVPNGSTKPQAYAANCSFCSALIVEPSSFVSGLSRLFLPGEKIVNFYSVWPLYEDEAKRQIYEGIDVLLDRLSRLDVKDVIDTTRRSA